MAITAEGNITGEFAIDGAGFVVNATSADLSGCESILAAQGSGISIYLTHISISSASAITVTIGAGETTGAVTQALVGPVEFVATGYTYDVVFLTPVNVGANTALTVDASGAGNVTIIAEGYIK